MSKFLYPVDTDQLLYIRERGLVYVDKTDTDIIVLELKVDDTVENALTQIDDKGYAIPYETDASTGSAQVQRTVTKCGVSISIERGRHRRTTIDKQIKTQKYEQELFQTFTFCCADAVLHECMG